MRIPPIREGLKRPWVRALLLALATALVVGVPQGLGVFDTVESLLLDLRYLTRNRLFEPARDPNLVTIDWDEASIQLLGRWPWTWDRHAALVRFLDLFEVEQAGFVDDHFSEPELVTYPVDRAFRLSDILKGEMQAGNADAVRAILPRHAEELGAALREAGCVSVCADFTVPAFEGAGSEAPAAPPSETRTAEEEEAIRIAARLSAPLAEQKGLPIAVRMKAPVREVGGAVAAVGFSRILHDADGVVRRTPAVVVHEGRAYPNLAVAMAARRFGCKPQEIRVVPGRAVEFPGATYPDGTPVRIPIDDEGLMAVNWIGPYNDPDRERIRHLPFLMLAEHAVFLQGKSVAAGIDLGSVAADEARYALYDAMVQSRLIPDEQAGYLSWTLLDGLVAAFYQRGGRTWDDYLVEYLGGSDTGHIARSNWDAVLFNRAALEELAAGTRPVYSVLAKSLGVPEEDTTRIQFEQLLFFHDRGRADQLEPPLFYLTPLTLSESRTVLWSPLELRGRTAFVGLTATALNALNPTPFEKRSQMLGLQPNAFNTIVTGAFVRRLPPWLDLLLVFVYALVIVSLVLKLETVAQTVLTTFALGGYVGLSWAAFARYGLVLPITAPVLSIGLGHMSAVIVRYWEAQRERRKVRGLFAAMVSPTVLRLMEENPDKFRLAGEKKEATMFSSDVSGFTTISEGVTAGELASILNSYLTPMSDIIMKYDGFVDKYEGDAIKASFGVPLADPDHPWKGVCAALEQQEELVAVARMLLVKYGVRITARMGVNTGVVAAGNMGSERKMQYTVMGEQVALAEELEPINKLYESWIAIGPETERLSRGFVETRHLDTAFMGASHAAVAIHEPLGWRRVAYLERWKGRPVPALFLEAWRKMTPEKVLGYAWYFSRKRLPESPFRTEVVTLFEKLSATAVEAMKAEDRLGMVEFLAETRDLEELVARLGAPAASPAAGARPEEANAAWEHALLAVRRRLVEAAALAGETGGRISGEDRDEILKLADILDKRTECYRKRCTFPEPGDVVAETLAEHLKLILADPANALAGTSLPALTAQRDAARAKIAEATGRFCDSLASPSRAEAFHEFMAGFCEVDPRRLELRALFEKARAEYVKRNWDEAERLFREGLALVPGDGPCQKYLERVAHLRRNPPPEDWDGVWAEE